MGNHVSLYIHIPFCHKKCDYCDFYSVGENDRKGKVNDLSDSYIEAVVNEVGFYAKRYSVEKWTTVYVGGGTPSILNPGQINTLLKGIKSAASFSDDCEVTFEMNPDDVTEEMLRILADNEVNRISMGIQALDDNALNKVSRNCDVKTIFSALETLKKNWHRRLSVDFIAGLPGQTYGSFENQFEILDSYPGIDHVSLYTLTVEENTPLWKKIEEGKVKFSYEKADRMWILGREILKCKGFLQYEVSNFSKKGHESRHNCSYWSSKSYIGCGSGATGTWNEKSKALRWTDTLSIPAYVNFWTAHSFCKDDILLQDQKIPANYEELDSETLEFEFLMMGFRTFAGVSSKEYFSRFGKSLEKRLGVDSGVFAEWKKNRLAVAFKKNDDVFYALNEKGLMLLNRFLEELL